MAPTKPTGPTGKTETTSQNPDPAPGAGAGPQSLNLERDEPVSWVYRLNKEALIAMLSGLDLEAIETVDELRRRLIKFLRDRAAETVVPPTEGPAPSAPVPSSVPVPSVPVLTQVPAPSTPVLTPERSSRPVRVQNWRVTFNGKGDPVAFLERVEELCESDGVDADQLLSHLPGLLQGEAAAWFRNNHFRLCYFPVSYQEDLEVEISCRLQRPTEPVTTYLTELQTLLRRHGSLRPEQQLSWMYRNLLPEYRNWKPCSGNKHGPPEGQTSKPPPQKCRQASQQLDQPHRNEPPPQRIPPLHRPQDSSPPPPCADDVNRRDTSVTRMPVPIEKRPRPCAQHEIRLLHPEPVKQRPWSSPIVLAKKKDGKYRFCIDFRKVNEVTRKDAHPLPFINVILDKLRRARYISTIDLKSGYWQSCRSDLHSAPATFQRLMDRVIGPELAAGIRTDLEGSRHSAVDHPQDASSGEAVPGHGFMVPSFHPRLLPDCRPAEPTPEERDPMGMNHGTGRSLRHPQGQPLRRSGPRLRQYIDGGDHVIAYASRSLTKPEQAYSTPEKMPNQRILPPPNGLQSVRQQLHRRLAGQADLMQAARRAALKIRERFRRAPRNPQEGRTETRTSSDVRSTSAPPRLNPTLVGPTASGETSSPPQTRPVAPICWSDSSDRRALPSLTGESRGPGTPLDLTVRSRRRSPTPPPPSRASNEGHSSDVDLPPTTTTSTWPPPCHSPRPTAAPTATTVSGITALPTQTLVPTSEDHRKNPPCPRGTQPRRRRMSRAPTGERVLRHETDPLPKLADPARVNPKGEIFDYPAAHHLHPDRRTHTPVRRDKPPNSLPGPDKVCTPTPESTRSARSPHRNPKSTTRLTPRNYHRPEVPASDFAPARAPALDQTDAEAEDHCNGAERDGWTEDNLYGRGLQAPRLPRPESLCWRCGVPGHSRGDCRAPSVLFCPRCGTMGLLSRECSDPLPLPSHEPPPAPTSPPPPLSPATTGDKRTQEILFWILSIPAKEAMSVHVKNKIFTKNKPGNWSGKDQDTPQNQKPRADSQRQKRRRLLSLRDEAALITARNKPDHDSSPETEQKLFRGGTQVGRTQLKQEKTEDQNMEEIKQILLELSREVNWEKEKLDLEEKITKTEEKIEKLEKDKIHNSSDRNADGDRRRRATEKHNGKNDKQRVETKGENKMNYTLYYAGEKKQGKNGTALFVAGGIRNKIMQYEAVDGRISWMRIENKQANITMINAYAPTENSKEEEKTKFYDKLEKVCEKVKRNDIFMIVRDFNAKIGKEERNEGVAGKETIHDTINNNGAKICDLAATTNTFIVSTQYRHKREHKITWMIPVGTEGNQRDHMLISKKWKIIIQDVRTYRGPNVDSDHLLVVAKMRMKVVKQTGGSRKNRWDEEKLNHTRHNDEYKKEMRKKLETREEEVDIDEEWKNLKESTMDTAETVLGRRTTRKRKEWFDEECEKRTEAKNQARNRWLKTGNLKDLENYKEKRKEETKYCKHKKESWIGELVPEVEVNNRDSRKLEKKEKVEMEDSNNEDDALSYDEYMEIAQLKTKKAAGPEQISNELIKQGGHELLSRVYRILVAVWQSETMPEEWRTGLLIPLLKKGDPTQCSNYRGIMLLNTTYKILTSIIRKRLTEHTET
ncbi:hypothetical protein GEV33_004600 [Tenebrio molitor]|uniref:CCHC-type domain-containing protein n=1 Tax=Tenebrio molitor TaxID=7067 RepID=A0A8J6HR82_TENMO|nr:hypothetical protein GEV33_004600 [Tenebrio molitor]